MQRLPVGRLVRVLPVASALVISLAGVAICYGAVQSIGMRLSAPAPPSVLDRQRQVPQAAHFSRTQKHG